ncbi:hypothetical protein [Methylomonas methanica]|uniref:hypothetical protein n=1 Tax=Methylomonas methanica TaxID=421 RepID=UPI000B263EAA|nr:hypothetical protein [Methylomonas methanica]
MEKWQADKFPALKAEAKRTGAAIYFTDEASVRSDFHAGTTWASDGRRPGDDTV